MKNEKQKTTFKNSKSGFAILYSVLIASILLSIGLAIFNITIKELLFSSLGKESQLAFYAADTGVECALYWDFASIEGAFSTSSSSSIECANTIIPNMGGQGYGYTNQFTLNLTPESYCTEVSVTKFESPAETVIEARGYNICDGNSSRRVERAIKVTY
jgi:hypothetical protein